MKKIFAFIDRNFNIIFNKKKCYKLDVNYNGFKYNDVIWNGVNHSRCLGNGWYKLMPTFNPYK